MNENQRIFFREKPVEFMIQLLKKDGKKYTTKIAKETNTTYSHATQIKKRLEELKLIKEKKEGRIILMKLTPMGIKLAKRINEVYHLLK